MTDILWIGWCSRWLYDWGTGERSERLDFLAEWREVASLDFLLLVLFMSNFFILFYVKAYPPIYVFVFSTSHKPSPKLGCTNYNNQSSPLPCQISSPSRVRSPLTCFFVTLFVWFSLPILCELLLYFRNSVVPYTTLSSGVHVLCFVLGVGITHYGTSAVF